MVAASLYAGITMDNFFICSILFENLKEPLYIISMIPISFIGLFLIITACVNFINLATAQALKRAREVGIRKVLGSLRGQLFWQFITETALITIIAAIAAIGLAYIALPSINEWFKTQMAINLLSDSLLIIFIPLLVLVVVLLAGSYPGLILSGFQPVSALKGKLSQQHIGGFNTRRTLIVTQFTISMVLIIDCSFTKLGVWA